MTVVLVSAVLAVGGRRRTLVAAVLLVTPALVGTWVDHLRPDLLRKEVVLVPAMVFVLFVIVQFLGFIRRAARVNAEVLSAAIATYLMMAILWSFAYTVVARLVPDSFHFAAQADPHRSMQGFEALYFSFVTLSTVGYGDIIPVSNAARTLAMMEATTGMFYVAVLIARLVAIYSSNQPTQAIAGPVPPTPVVRAEQQGAVEERRPPEATGSEPGEVKKQ
jgi:hypothetical protein